MAKCRSCKADIVWLKTEQGRHIPINADTVSKGDKIFDFNKHKAHFATCPDAAKHRRKE